MNLTLQLRTPRERSKGLDPRPTQPFSIGQIVTRQKGNLKLQTYRITDITYCSMCNDWSYECELISHPGCLRYYYTSDLRS